MCSLFAGLVVLSLQPRKAFAEDATGLSDRQITHHINCAIVEDRSLPYCAHVVKVQSENGKVTLKGKVDTQEQKKIIEEKAKEVVGDENVTNNIQLRGS